ncbi:hypothetical protein AGABI2DRAFT_192735 [Agaricus bisporus var. bisporus H97]|uniref:hypothetical protein n=1 Tax=Agaricus bisporus var. bisporus (strain H97 / ATCC MYA-4626 / FGSC 10389) TaxID=936046 RepID=UPI00029F5060|nr:hypothetical protein AGABI2DRAFT_192735 [Agaricus bisporus var. bisporus H97]EKV47553.1 hypothetical protein AGABI2DRAFT_192735 [Agaricus bisporus var. bisporus H97]
MNFLPRNRRVVTLLRLFWLVLSLWYEHFVFQASVRSCTWPKPKAVDQQNIDGPPPSHILIIADPQILDHRSYPGRPAFLTYLTRLVVDLNLRKNWRAAIAKNPDAVVFLGDMMDGGRMDMSDDEYEDYYSRFKDIFRMDKAIYQFYIPGNHDTGLQSRSVFSPLARSRYISHFGPLNNRASISNHTLLFFDAPGFVQEDYERAGQRKSFAEWRPKVGGPFEFVRTVGEVNDLDPAVLFTHIPLYRPDGKSCGPLREKGTIRPGVGFGYQNTLGKDSTSFVLHQMRPTVVFSGDDHDYCEHTHQSVISTPVNEVTIKSLSMAMNVRKPGFQLLSLFPATTWDNVNPTYAHVPCLLPDQLGIYQGVYIPCALVSLLIVIVAAVMRGRTSDHDKKNISKLPDPATNPHQNQTSVVCFGRRRRLLGLGCLFGNKGSRRTSKRGLVQNILRDVLDIAVFPISIFVIVTVLISL